MLRQKDCGTMLNWCEARRAFVKRSAKRNLRRGLVAGLGMAALLAVPLMGPRAAFANKANSSLPAATLSAQTIYIDNQTNDGGLQNNACMGLAKWGRLRVVGDAKRADVVLRLTGTSYVKSVPSDTPPAMVAPGKNSLLPNGYEPAPDGYTRLTLVDGRTGEAVWSGLSKTNSVQATAHIVDGLREAFEQGLRGK